MLKRQRKTVELTSLLDLLFVMIFLSLLQTKNPPAKAEPQVTQKPKKETPVEVRPPPAAILAVTAIFHFYGVNNNPDQPVGTYAMGGTFDRKTGELALGGVSWISRPEGYDMVPLKGRINAAGNTFTGKIDFQDCEEFTLRRKSKIPGSDIAGEWTGSYVCFQGETGLTLTIQ